MKNKEKMNNKGFSLVELIIVIAIMVILVGVLAPVYTRYVESTRKSADVDAVASIANAMEIVLIDNDARGISGISITATFTGGTIAFAGTGTGGADAATEVTNTIGAYNLKGNWTSGAAAVTAGTLTATVGTDGNVSYTLGADPNVFSLIAAYSPAIHDKLGVTP